ncbi:hypothetical protein NDU88_001284 [Pleurodeles waltl]|uniref:Uncharacterized protein n=1 Tax=Pleurodeles waltl TaxID=8319 RepID=A0AAV7MPH0_PLEWA|nr:hypothetical protein NDU88_001284 [Pleurodeles waltl]
MSVGGHHQRAPIAVEGGNSDDQFGMVLLHTDIRSSHWPSSEWRGGRHLENSAGGMVHDLPLYVIGEAA